MPDAQDYLADRGMIPGVALGMPGSDQAPPPQQAQPQAPQAPSMAGVRPPPLPALPQYQNIPQAPRQDFADPIKAFQNPAVVLATLGSLLTRAPLTTAMNAGGAAMEAFHKGDMQTAELKQKEWEQAARQAEAQNKIELEKYKEAWERRDVDVKQKFAELAALGAGYSDPLINAAVASGNPEIVEKIILAREQAKIHLSNVIETERARFEIRGEKIDPAITNQLGNYPGVVASDLRNTPPTSQKRILSAFESGASIEAIAQFAKDNPDSYGLLAEATKRMKIDAYDSLFRGKPLSTDVVSGIQADREKMIDDVAKQQGFNETAAARAKILGKMLTTQAFNDAAQAGSRGATIYLDKAFREIYDQASTPEAFFGILHQRYKDADRFLEQYHLGFDNRSDKEKFPFWNQGARGYVTGGQVPPPAQREVGRVYPTPKGPLQWTGTGWVPPAQQQSF